jgi:predicted dehydrogenase
VLKIGLIGLGYWGPNLARVVHTSDQCVFAACSDLDIKKLDKITRQYPEVKGFRDADELLSTDVDAVLIATPISTHYELARQALRQGKHVFVEKPLADSSSHAEELTTLAHNFGRTLMTGHTFIYAPAVVRVKELIDAGDIGEMRYISISRVNLGLFQRDVDVVWDLAVHDLSILLYWLGESPIQAACFGRRCMHPDKYDVAFLWFKFPSGTVASCEVSWLAPQKMRRTCVVGSEKMIVYDDMEPSDKIKIYERGVSLNPPNDFGEFQLTYRMGNVVSPSLANVEPLGVEIEHFLRCVKTGETPVTNGKFGTAVVQAIEMALQSQHMTDEGDWREKVIAKGKRRS